MEQFAQYEAVALFIERAVAVKAAFARHERERLSRRGGLLPTRRLAAGDRSWLAARVRVLPPTTDAGAAEATGCVSSRVAHATLPTRQQTLRGMMDWSYGLLTRQRKRVFRQMAVFVGGCALVAAESICNADGQMDVLNGLQSLLDKNLLKQTEVDGEARFSMLETIREYAREKLLESGENERVRARH